MIHQIYHSKVKEVKDWLRIFKKSLTAVTQCGIEFQRKVKDYYDFFTLKVIDTYTHTYYAHTHTHIMYRYSFRCFFKKSLTDITN